MRNVISYKKKGYTVIELNCRHYALKNNGGKIEVFRIPLRHKLLRENTETYAKVITKAICESLL